MIWYLKNEAGKMNVLLFVKNGDFIRVKWEGGERVLICSGRTVFTQEEI